MSTDTSKNEIQTPNAAVAKENTTNDEMLTEPVGLSGKPRGAEPLSSLQPKNADLLLNPENLHPPLPPRQTISTDEKSPFVAKLKRPGPNQSNNDVADGTMLSVDQHNSTSSDDKLSVENNSAYQKVLMMARSKVSESNSDTAVHKDSTLTNKNDDQIVDDYLVKQRMQARALGAVDDTILNEIGGYDTDDEQRIDALMQNDFETRQEKEIKKLLRFHKRRERLKKKQEKSQHYRGTLEHPYNMDAVRRRLNGFSGIKSLHSSYQRHRFRKFRTLKPAKSFSYDESGNLVRHVKRSYGNGVTFEGDVFEGKWHGRGTLTDSKGGKYEGEFKNGEKHGLGVCTFGPVEVPDTVQRSGFRIVYGQKYEGYYEFGKRVGSGKLWCGNDTGEPPFDVYVGEFKDDLFHGEGTIHKTNGEIYRGSWRRGYRHGYGEISNLKGRNGHTYQGHLLRGVYHGQGVLDNGKNGKYAGMWKLGYKHGAGRTDFADGGFFVGIYHENVFKRGKLRNGNGDEYDGTFDFHGLFSGKGKMRFANGEVEIFHDDESMT